MNSLERTLARQTLALNRKRDAQIGSRLFSDSGWEILLALYECEEAVGVNCISCAVKMPEPMMHRWLGLLIDKGWVLREPRARAEERFRLSEDGRAKLDAVLNQAVLGHAA